MHMPLLLEMRDAMIDVGFVDLQTLPFQLLPKRIMVCNHGKAQKFTHFVSKMPMQPLIPKL